LQEHIFFINVKESSLTSCTCPEALQHAASIQVASQKPPSVAFPGHDTHSVEFPFDLSSSLNSLYLLTCSAKKIYSQLPKGRLFTLTLFKNQGKPVERAKKTGRAPSITFIKFVMDLLFAR
jgi:hypothetical protein